MLAQVELVETVVAFVPERHDVQYTLYLIHNSNSTVILSTNIVARYF